MALMSHPTPDHSVRTAWAEDAAAVASLQAEAWRATYQGTLPEAVVDLDVEQATAAWRAALVAPRDARNRVLVALDRARVVGFAVTSPSGDPDSDPVADAELTELTVAASRRGQGHGSRLLQAAVDTMRADRFTRAVCWLLSTDDDGREFLTRAGWGADSAHRELDLDGSGASTVRQVRLHTSLT